MKNKELGYLGEQFAEEFLEGKGFEVLEKNFTIQGGEIDIVAVRKSRIHFVEVKTRTSESWLPLESTITYTKLRHLTRSAYIWIDRRNYSKVFWQIDFIGIIISPENKVKKITFIEDITGL